MTRPDSEKSVNRDPIQHRPLEQQEQAEQRGTDKQRKDQSAQQGGEGGRPAQSHQSGDRYESDRQRDKRDLDTDRRQQGESSWNEGNR